jgi:glycosyltransferase involved in cell wall biosynthesis
MIFQPKISVGIPVYNAEKYIKEAITSIITQDYQGDIEIIIAYDKGSSDKTLDILNNLKKTLPTHRELMIISHEHTTPFRARMLIFKNFSGDYIHLFDYDNIMPSNRISKVVEYIRNTRAEFLFSNAKIIDSEGGDTGRFLVDIKDPYSILRLIRGNFVDASTMVISRSCVNNLMRSLIKLQHRFFDWIFEDWLIALLAMKHCKTYYMNDTYILYRIHETNITAGRSDIYKSLFNLERGYKTLVAFYFLEYKNLNNIEKKELSRAFMSHSNLLNREVVNNIGSWDMKIYYNLIRLIRKILLKL